MKLEHAPRAVFFNRLGEIRDHSFEQQRYRASGLNLLTAAIVLRNTVYLDRAIQALTTQDPTPDTSGATPSNPAATEPSAPRLGGVGSAG